MATTQLQVCNYSLLLAGSETITQAELTAATIKRAVLCDTFYVPLLKDLQRQHNWNFMKTTVELSAISGDVDEGGWSYDFTLPTDYIQAIAIHYTDNGGPVPDGAWEIIDDTLYCEHSEISLEYAAYKVQHDDWSFDFAKLFKYVLALELSYPLTTNEKLAARLEFKVDKLLKDVRFNNARENGRRDWAINDFTDSRTDGI